MFVSSLFCRTLDLLRRRECLVYLIIEDVKHFADDATSGFPTHENALAARRNQMPIEQADKVEYFLKEAREPAITDLFQKGECHFDILLPIKMTTSKWYLNFFNFEYMCILWENYL